MLKKNSHAYLLLFLSILSISCNSKKCELEIESAPTELEIFLNDKSVGSTPLKIYLHPGKHKINIKGDNINEERTIVLTEYTSKKMCFDIIQIQQSKEYKLKMNKLNAIKKKLLDKLELVFVKGNTTIQDFSITKFEITFSQYDDYCDAVGLRKPSDNKWGRGNRPVININWIDANAYAIFLGGQLPDTAEWVYAAKGGNQSRNFKYSGSNDVNTVAWNSLNSNLRTHPVGQKQPNELGIYDMSGNVTEWCNNWLDSLSEEKQIRGGSWRRMPEYSTIEHVRSYRFNQSSDNKGFRIIFPK